MDEVDFVKGADLRYQQSSVMDTYTTIKRRMESRFSRPNGTLPAMLFLISSKKSEQDFIESYVDDLRKDKEAMKGVKIVDEPIWNVKPQNYSGSTFSVAVGDKHLPSRIVNPHEDLESLKLQGYSILNVPIEHKQAFSLDLSRALMDIAGVSTLLSSKFITIDQLKCCYSSSRVNPFSTDIITTGVNDDMKLTDFFNPNLIPKELFGLPQFIHIDTSLSGDKTGISSVVISGLKSVNRQNYDLSESESLELVFSQLFGVSIQAPSNSEISFEKTRQFIYYLRSIGMDIQGVSTDGYQSADLRQLLSTAGFNSQLLSLDRTPTGYLSMRSAISEKRIELLNIPLQEEEFINLERNNQTGKIDHPINGCIPDYMKIRTNKGFYDIPTLIEFELAEPLIEKPKVLVYDTLHRQLKYSEYSNARETRQVSELYVITTSNGAELHCTDNHLILTQRGYRKAAEVHYMDMIACSNSSNEEVSYESIESISIRKLNKNIPVYDIEVPQYHNFVLESGLVIHNSKDLSDAVTGALYNALSQKEDIINRMYAANDVNMIIDTNQPGLEEVKSELLQPITTNSNLTNDNHNIQASNYDDFFIL